MCWTFTTHYHLLCGLCQLRWYWASMPAQRTLPCWPSPKIAFRLSSEAGAYARPGARRRKAGSTHRREVTHTLSVPTRLCSDSGDDEIEHAVGSIRVGRMFTHQGDSVDESNHVEHLDIRADFFCGLGAEQEDFSRLVHRFVRFIDSRSRNVLGSHDGCSHASPSSREVHLETKPAHQGVERDRSACEFFSVLPQCIGLIQEHG